MKKIHLFEYKWLKDFDVEVWLELDFLWNYSSMQTLKLNSPCPHTHEGLHDMNFITCQFLQASVKPQMNDLVDCMYRPVVQSACVNTCAHAHICCD